MTLYIFPNTLGNRRVDLLPAGISEVLPKLQGLIAESDRGGRTFLSLWKVQEIHKFPIAVLSKNARSVKAWDFYLEPIVKNKKTGDWFLTRVFLVLPILEQDWYVVLVILIYLFKHFRVRVL